MDCFYAAVEMRDNPEYQNVPLAVGWDGPRSVLCTCNYIARQYGVRSAMPAITAKQLCPDLKIVNGRMSVYKEVSEQIRRIFKRYTQLIEPLSLDEAYLDVSDCQLYQGSATLIAQAIRADILAELSLTASAGVAPNKFIAKIASDENKPNGQYIVAPHQVASFVENLPLKKIPGIGPKTFAKLSHHGFNTCNDVRNSTIFELEKIIGKQATSLYKRSFGQDDRAVETSRARKSLAIETTLPQDLMNIAHCQKVVHELLPKLEQRLIKITDRKITKLGVKLKFADFAQTTVEQQGGDTDLDTFLSLLDKAYQRSKGRGVRLVGLTLGFKAPEQPQSSNQLTLPL